MENVSFGWYAKRVTIPTLVGFVAGIVTYIGLNSAHIPQIASLGM